MKINKLRLKNFRSYEDEVEFDFTTSNDKNIVLIGGNNGAGKSTIFESIKLCIYGPLAYKYQGFHSSYIYKIKSNINDNAIKNNFVDAYVSIDIELIENTEKNNYTLTRKWTYTDKKLEEAFEVYKNFSKEPLNSDKLNYFENYIKSIISPKIFEFFFFDGEQISDFFIGKSTKNQLQESLLALCNYDNFDILKSFVVSSSRRTKIIDNEEVQKAHNQYLELEYNHIQLNKKHEDLIAKIEDISIDIEDLQIMKQNLESSFRERGGKLLEEIEQLNDEQTLLENRRGEINQIIKNFCNEILPFLILKNRLPVIKTQIENENKYLVYDEVKDKISEKYIINILKDRDKEFDVKGIAKLISNELIKDMKPRIDDDEFEIIHDLTNDKTSEVLSYINSILGFENQEIKSLFKELQDIGIRAGEIRKELQSTLDNDELNEFIKETEKLNNKITVKTKQNNDLENTIAELQFRIKDLDQEVEKGKKNYLNLLKTNNVVDISVKVIDLLDDIISTLTKNKVKQVEVNFIHIFNKLIRKEKFIDGIKIDDKFNVTLYINKFYNSIDVENMMENIGHEQMLKKLGDMFFKDLYREYKVNNKSQLISALKENSSTKFINLRTKLEVNNLSNGEKQIYILCLYWALIKAADMEIPFIIDTPYARIDDAHRKNIASEYFSTISNQVIVLSTDTEVDLSAYKSIKDRINKEYLIEYDEKDRKTIKNNRYFYGV